MITRQKAIEIAKQKAQEFWNATHGITPIDYTYLVNVNSPEWQPHEWVIAAIMEAADKDYPLEEVAKAAREAGIGFTKLETM